MNKGQQPLIMEHYQTDGKYLDYSAIGYGEEHLINQESTAAAHAENRKIEAKVQVTRKVAVDRQIQLFFVWKAKWANGCIQLHLHQFTLF